MKYENWNQQREKVCYLRWLYIQIIQHLLYLYLYEYVEDTNTGFNSTGEREHLLMVSESRSEALNGGSANYIFLQQNEDIVYR